MSVPSLYVRVYRTLEECEAFVERSLTIREGISTIEEFKRVREEFPHYT